MRVYIMEDDSCGIYNARDEVHHHVFEVPWIIGAFATFTYWLYGKAIQLALGYQPEKW